MTGQFLPVIKDMKVTGLLNKYTKILLGLGLLGLVTLPLLTRSIKYIPVGSVGIVEGGGESSLKKLDPGLNFVNPSSEITVISTRMQDVKEKIETNSREGLKYDLDVSLQFRLASDKLTEAYKILGNDRDTILIPRFRSITREVTALYPLEETLSTRRQEVAAKLKQRLQESLAPLGFIVDEVLLRQVYLPDDVQQAINNKIKVQQQAEQVASQISQSRQEAEVAKIKAISDAQTKKIQAEADAETTVIRAKAESEAQRLRTVSLNPMILKLRSIEAAEKIGSSPNAKVSINVSGP